ncbi:hypothetical protein CGK14_09980 [Vibrio parahaemolyticus]|uniref:hypothetical protein n=1 Tax=Vibrio parahaemolyticus TaxID=670 RepID=UPI0003FB5F90|nr:hypothetical protein [Vibrio parahaemolyticus]TBT72687.1 hypothetical protein D5E70_23760 [Vibrio parahaemolyticus]TOB04907.1 hypothetical protein CGK14_09980 [Vibrio parahaemolyticus]TOB73005.1 hypothetical protein CGJ98_22425 [Vibrio parahaemolyticus]HCG6410549.1 hypothetical protein [Vibrio parahaemolyticus]HCG6476661.1 hypothetical protein [Vibrio parahaemolyticus]
MNKDKLDIFQQIIDRSLWFGSEDLKSQGWCITSNEIEDELYRFVRKCGASELDAIEVLLTERFDTLLLPELERETSLLISPYSDMLQESIRAFKLGFYNICVPSLFSIIEAALMFLANRGEYKSIRYVSGIRNRANSEQLHYSLRSKLNDIANITEELFSKIQFDQKECDTQLNRHASVHGRRETPYTKTDCLKLFLLLSSIKSCFSN